MIIILFPTARPKVCKRVIRRWIKDARDKASILVKFVVDTRDHERILSDLELECKYDVTVCDSVRSGVTYPLYYLTSRLEANDEDIIILASDDFYTRRGWDDYVREKYKDFDGLLVTRDGIQDSKDKRVVTHPILTFNCLKQLNRIIYNPVYHHMCSDVELFDVAEDLGIILDTRGSNDTSYFEHRHYMNERRNLDDVDRKVLAIQDRDKMIYAMRKLQLSTKEKLKVK